MEDELRVVERIDQDRSLCISPLSRKAVAEAEISHLGSDRGFFVYEVDERPAGGGVQVLAKVASLDAAFRLIEILRGLRSADKMRQGEPDHITA